MAGEVNKDVSVTNQNKSSRISLAGATSIGIGGMIGAGTGKSGKWGSIPSMIISLTQSTKNISDQTTEMSGGQ